LLLIGLYIAATYWAASWMLEPINREAGRLALETRFQLSDVLGLMALLQVPLAVAGQAIETSGSPDGDNSPYWLLLLISCGLMVVLWGAGVSVVSRAGITRLMPRLAVIVLLVPGAMAVIVAWPFLLMFYFELARAETSVRLFGLGFGGLVLLLGAMMGVRRLAFWAVVGSIGTTRSVGSLGSHAERGNQ
jgi:hypothetical protein